jgi:hypothetical protein
MAKRKNTPRIRVVAANVSGTPEDVERAMQIVDTLSGCSQTSCQHIAECIVQGSCCIADESKGSMDQEAEELGLRIVSVGFLRRWSPK